MSGLPFGVAFPSPGLPGGVDPETYRIDAVNAAIRQAAFLPMLTVPDPQKPNTPIFSPTHPDRIVGVHLNEQPHRFEIRPARLTAGRVAAANQAGEQVADVSVRWMLCPDDFEPAPGREPPPTELDPSKSQRFVMLDGRFSFHDKDHSGFFAFGAGRTFPVMVDGKPQLELGCVVTSLEGFGRMRGLTATNVVNGYIDPPAALLLSFLWRVVDPAGRLRAGSSMTPLVEIPDPAPGTTVMAFLGETDPNERVTLNISPDGEMQGSNVVERLRLAYMRFDAKTASGVRARLIEGPIVGSLRGVLNFNPLVGGPVVPFHTSGGELTFFDRVGRPIGRLFADIFEGQAFPMSLPPAPMPVFRFGGFGPFAHGEGCFAGLTGMMSLNAVVSVFPRTLTNMYLLRFNDPQRRLRASLSEAWL